MWWFCLLLIFHFLKESLSYTAWKIFYHVYTLCIFQTFPQQSLGEIYRILHREFFASSSEFTEMIGLKWVRNTCMNSLSYSTCSSVLRYITFTSQIAFIEFLTQKSCHILTARKRWVTSATGWCHSAKRNPDKTLVCVGSPFTRKAEMWNANSSRTVPVLYRGEMDRAYLMSHRSEVDERQATGNCPPQLGWQLEF